MSRYDPKIHKRRSIRLKGYDYSRPGLYFVTICVQHKKCLFGGIRGNQLQLNEAGQMVQAEWEKLPRRFPNVRLHEYVVMPNHFHAILEITSEAGSLPEVAEFREDHTPAPGPEVSQQQQGSAVKKTLGQIVGAFQSITTVAYIRGVKTQNWPPFQGKLWQRNYWDRIIRDENAYQNISAYIINNPAKWIEDRFNPKK